MLARNLQHVDDTRVFDTLPLAVRDRSGDLPILFPGWGPVYPGPTARRGGRRARELSAYELIDLSISATNRIDAQ